MNTPRTLWREFIDNEDIAEAARSYVRAQQALDDDAFVDRLAAIVERDAAWAALVEAVGR